MAQETYALSGIGWRDNPSCADEVVVEPVHGLVTPTAPKVILVGNDQ